MTALRHGFLALITAILAGCGSSPPIHYYALASVAPHQASGGARLLVEVLPVALPERLNRGEMVLTSAAGQLDVRDADRWAAPLPDEIRQILSDALWNRLGAADVYQAPVAPNATELPQVRLALRIERFEAVPGRSAIVEGSWTARRLPQGRSVTCRTSVAVALPTGTPEGAAAALSDGTGRLALQVADSIGLLVQDGVLGCPADGR